MRVAGWSAVLLALMSGAGVLAAQEAPPPEITIELNKLEAVDAACRIFLVLQNRGKDSYDALTLELVSFGPEGVIGERLGVDLAPLRPEKTAVKLFDLPATGCDRVSRILVNDVSACSAGGVAIADCLDRLKVSARGQVELFK